MQEFDLQKYLTNGVESIVRNIIKATLVNPAASLFMLQYAKAIKKANRLRIKAASRGEHIPPFLIASISTMCNLHCGGCYARANNSCGDLEQPFLPGQLSAEQWQDVFRQAGDLGISFILLAGGEPLLREDVILAAGSQRNILFPIFTNGTLIDDRYVQIFVNHSNLLPVLSLEGGQDQTDKRRGNGVYTKIMKTMQRLRDKRIIYGVSVTVHSNNMQEIMSAEFLDMLRSQACKAIIYVEYVPVDNMAGNLAPDEADRQWMTRKLNILREQYDDLLFISFPGDEKETGGCLAAGRGFFHINAVGGAEPCPFSPYSDTNIRNVSLAQALQSPLFVSLRNSGAMLEEHVGGCVLFDKAEMVRGLVKQ